MYFFIDKIVLTCESQDPSLRHSNQSHIYTTEIFNARYSLQLEEQKFMVYRRFSTDGPVDT